MKSTLEYEPDLLADDVVQTVAEGSGVSRAQILIAIDYWTAYPNEIDNWIQTANEAEERAFEK